MRIATLLPIALLVGCAVRPYAPQRPPEEMASNVEVCEAVFYFPPAIAQRAQGEAIRRGIDCREYMPAASELNARRSAEATARSNANMDAAIRLLAPRPAVNCTTTSAFGIANTTCR